MTKPPANLTGEALEWDSQNARRREHARKPRRRAVLLNMAAYRMTRSHVERDNHNQCKWRAAAEATCYTRSEAEQSQVLPEIC